MSLLQTLIDAKYERIAKLQDAIEEMQEDAAHMQAMLRNREHSEALCPRLASLTLALTY